MPYQISRHAPDLLWVVVEGRLTLPQADAYFHELWAALDRSPNPTDLLIDGRRADNSSPAARRRTEQVAHHPHFGHLAFVVSAHHLMLFGPFMHLVSGISMFGHEDEALAFLRGVRGQPPAGEAVTGFARPSGQARPPAPAPRVPPALHGPPAEAQAHERSRHHPTRPLPPPPASRVRLSAQQVAAPLNPPLPAPPEAPPAPPPPGLLGALTDIVDGLSSGLRGVARRIERDQK